MPSLRTCRCTSRRSSPAHAQIARRWLGSVAVRLAHIQNRLGLLGDDLTAQAARLLLDEADDDGAVTISHHAGGNARGAAPSLNKVLHHLADQDLITVAYRRITVNDRSGLAAVG